MSVLKFEKKEPPEVQGSLSKRDLEVLQQIKEIEARITHLERKNGKEFATSTPEVSKMSFQQIAEEILDSDSGHWFNYPTTYKALIYAWKRKRAELR